jgi:hypothetical protein
MGTPITTMKLNYVPTLNQWRLSAPGINGASELLRPGTTFQQALADATSNAQYVAGQLGQSSATVDIVTSSGQSIVGTVDSSGNLIAGNGVTLFSSDGQIAPGLTQFVSGGGPANTGQVQPVSSLTNNGVGNLPGGNPGNIITYSQGQPYLYNQATGVSQLLSIQPVIVNGNTIEYIIGGNPYPVNLVTGQINFNNQPVIVSQTPNGYALYTQGKNGLVPLGTNSTPPILDTATGTNQVWDSATGSYAPATLTPTLNPDGSTQSVTITAPGMAPATYQVTNGAPGMGEIVTINGQQYQLYMDDTTTDAGLELRPVVAGGQGAETTWQKAKGFMGNPYVAAGMFLLGAVGLFQAFESMIKNKQFSFMGLFQMGASAWSTVQGLANLLKSGLISKIPLVSKFFSLFHGNNTLAGIVVVAAIMIIAAILGLRDRHASTNADTATVDAAKQTSDTNTTTNNQQTTGPWYSRLPSASVILLTGALAGLATLGLVMDPSNPNAPLYQEITFPQSELPAIQTALQAAGSTNKTSDPSGYVYVVPGNPSNGTYDKALWFTKNSNGTETAQVFSLNYDGYAIGSTGLDSYMPLFQAIDDSHGNPIGITLNQQAANAINNSGPLLDVANANNVSAQDRAAAVKIAGQLNKKVTYKQAPVVSNR